MLPYAETWNVNNNNSPIISEPPSPMNVINGSITNLTWIVKQNDPYKWAVRLPTVNFTLYPPPQLPPTIPSNAHNVTYESTEGHSNSTIETVTLTIFMDDSIIKHVPFVLLRLLREDNYSISYDGMKVDFKLLVDSEPITTTQSTDQTDTTTGQQTELAMDITSSANQSCLHKVLYVVFISRIIMTYIADIIT